MAITIKRLSCHTLKQTLQKQWILAQISLKVWGMYRTECEDCEIIIEFEVEEPRWTQTYVQRRYVISEDRKAKERKKWRSIPPSLQSGLKTEWITAAVINIEREICSFVRISSWFLLHSHHSTNFSVFWSLTTCTIVTAASTRSLH